MAKIERDQLVMLVVKASTLIILCLMLTNVLHVSAQPRTVGPRSGQAKTLQEKVRQIYTSQIGIREKGYNSGVAVERYLRYVNLSKGNPWCAAFVCWAFGEAGVINPRSGWSPALFGEGHLIWDREPRTKSKESRLVGSRPSGFSNNHVDGIKSASRSAYPPRPITDYRLPITYSSPIKTPLDNPPTPTTADIFGLYFKEKGRIAHVGFVDQWNGTWMISVEGNTNVAGSREGDGVYRKRRLVKSVHQVARYINH